MKTNCVFKIFNEATFIIFFPAAFSFGPQLQPCHFTADVIELGFFFS